MNFDLAPQNAAVALGEVVGVYDRPDTNSIETTGTYATGMGTNWRTNYDRYLHIINPAAIYGVVAERPDGQQITFTSSAGTYTPDSDVDLKLTKSGSTWTLTDQNDNSEIYFTSGSCPPSAPLRQRPVFA